MIRPEGVPSEHIADTGYVSGAHLAQSQDDYGIDLIGPVLPDTSWQALTEGAFDISQFHIDWDSQTATCPQGQTTHAWRKGTDRHNNALIQIRFSSKQCAACPARAHCTRSTIGGRTLTLRGHQEHIAIQTARKREQTQAFKDKYATRAGVEGVISQAAYVLRPAGDATGTVSRLGENAPATFGHCYRYQFETRC